MYQGATDYWKGKFQIIEEHLRNGTDLFQDPRVRHAISYPEEAERNHRAHLEAFKEKTGVDPYGLDCVVEIGGGFGGMCKLMNARTHVIIDFPVMLSLQAKYLGDREGLILFPVQSDLEEVTKLNPDLLLSCWSLSEATKESQERFRGLKFFGAKYILHGFATSKSADLPFTDFNGFDGYEVIWEGEAFNSPTERYRFMRKTWT